MTAMILAAAAAAALQAAEFHVAPDGSDRNDGSAAKPFQTLARAVKAAHAVEREGVKSIVMADGTYYMEKPVVLTAGDYDVAIRAEHPGKALLTCSVKVTGWRADEDDERFLVADFPYEPAPGTRFALTSAGTWCDIAAYPDFPAGPVMKLVTNADKSHIAYVADGLDFSGIDITSAWLVIPQEWATTVTFIKSHDADNHVFELATPAAMEFTRFNQGFRILNTRQGMRRPGQWFYELAKNRLVYWPREGENAENLDVRISKGHSMIKINPCAGARVEGLVFEGCSWLEEHKNPYGDTPNGAIAIGRARGAVIADCEVRNCAGPGIFAMKPERCLTTRCHVHDVGESCIEYFDGGTASDVTFCHVHDGGKYGTAMLIGMQLSDCKCVGNKIHDGPGNGVVMWSCRSIFASNEVYRTMKAQKDGGALYGGFNDCRLFDNYIHDTGGWCGLYADEGSQRDVYYNNRFENSWWPTHMHCAQYITVSNNTFTCDGAMRFSFQSSGHNVFCDNKIYTKNMITDDPYRENCDFWGRNEVFLKQPDGSYKPGGVVTFPRSCPKPGTVDLPLLPEKAPLPINLKGRGDMDAFAKGLSYRGRCSVGADGFTSVGVPDAGVSLAYDDNYLYVGVVRAYNALCGYPGMANHTSVGWKHCDAARVDFEGGKNVTFYPNGTWEATKGLRLAKDDVVNCGGGNCLMRIPLEDLKVKGAKKKLAKLDLETEDDGLLLTDEAEAEERGPEKKLPKPQDLVGCKLKFNVSIWVEDLRERKALFACSDQDPATGTLAFGKVGKKGK